VTDVSLTVSIRVNDDGTLCATHVPSTDADAATLARMRFGGQDVVAAALMGEAVRRQAELLVGLVKASDPAKMALLRTGDEKETGVVIAELLRNLTEVAEQVAPFAVFGAVRNAVGAEVPINV
jgi:hypothetical protein